MEPELQRGIELFNHREFFESHEALEAVWMHSAGARRWFLQSLIHLAVAFYHHECGNPAGEALQFEKGLKKLAGYLPWQEGIDTGALYQAVIGWRERGGKYPMIVSSQQSAISSSDSALPCADR
jgi:predicted metal-dependent hydrolase